MSSESTEALVEIKWKCKSFDELTNLELYRIMQLRNQVFVVEQRIVFNDADGRDPLALHLFGYYPGEDGELCAYCRIFEPGVVYGGATIGRVCSNLKLRRKGCGKALMREAVRECYSRFGQGQLIELGAQLYLQRFYEELGFKHDGSPVYLDGDQIDHIHMTRG